MELDLRVEQRPEEPEPFEVIEVQMRKQQMYRARLFAGEMQPERAQSGSCVQDDEVAGLCAQLDARRVSTGSNRVGTRRC